MTEAANRVPGVGEVVPFVCPRCQRRFECTLTAEEDFIREIEWKAYTGAKLMYCEVCADLAEERNRRYLEVQEAVVAKIEGREGELKKEKELAKLTPGEAKIVRAGFPLEMTKYDKKLAKPVGLELLAWAHERQEGSLWIADINGIGKTRAVCYLGAKLLGLGIDVKYFEALPSHIHYVGLRQKDNLDAERFIRNCRAQIVILNDIGQGGRISGTAGEFYNQILDNQINDGNWFWLTANVAAHQIGKKFDDWNTAEGFVDRIRRHVKPEGIWRGS